MDTVSLTKLTVIMLWLCYCPLHVRFTAGQGDAKKNNTKIKRNFMQDMDARMKSCPTLRPNENEKMGSNDSTVKPKAKCVPSVSISFKLVNKNEDVKEPEQILLETIYDDVKKTDVRLYSPIIIMLSHEPTIVTYPFKHEFSVNNRPYEAVYHSNLTCGPDGITQTGCVTNNNARVENDQSEKDEPGYCCQCEENFAGRKKSRAAQACDGSRAHISSHCLRHDNLWYSVNSLGQWKLVDQGSIRLFIDSDSGWVSLTEDALNVGSDYPKQVSANKKVNITYEPEMQDQIDLPLDPDNDLLLIPEPLAVSDRSVENREQLKGGASQYLIVRKSAMDRFGTKCNKIGVSYPAFAYQAERCQYNAQSCLNDQPADLWKRDSEQNANSSRLYWLSARATLSHHPIVRTKDAAKALQLQYQGNFSARVRIVMDSESTLKSLNNATNGVLMSAISHSADWSTIITAHVYNPGQAVSALTVMVVGCTPQASRLPRQRRVRLGPHRSARITLTPLVVNIESFSTNGSCSMQLLDRWSRLVAQRRVAIHHLDTCYCIGACVCRCGTSRTQECEPLTWGDPMLDSLLVVTGTTPAWHHAIKQLSFANAQKSETIFAFILLFLVLGIIKAMIGAYVSLRVGQCGLCLWADPDFIGEERPMSERKEHFLNLFFFFYIILIPLHLLKKAWNRLFNQGKYDKMDRIGGSKTFSSDRSQLDRQAAILQFRIQKRALEKLAESRKTEAESQTPTGYQVNQMNVQHNQEGERQKSLNFLNTMTKEQWAFIDRITRDCYVFLTFTEADPHLKSPGKHFSLCGHIRQVDRAYRYSLGSHVTQFFEMVGGTQKTLLTPLPINPKYFQYSLSLNEVLTRVQERPSAPCLNYAYEGY